jgi:hypothetical protein
MTNDALDLERQLIEEIQTNLPGFAQACRADADFVVLNQDAFAPLLGSAELLLLGKAIKYAGLVGKEVRIVPTPLRPSWKSFREIVEQLDPLADFANLFEFERGEFDLGPCPFTATIAESPEQPMEASGPNSFNSQSENTCSRDAAEGVTPQAKQSIVDNFSCDDAPAQFSTRRSDGNS